MRRFSTQEHLPIGYSQQILLDDDGRLVISCDSIFSTQLFRESSFLLVSPFLESIYSVLQTLRIKDPALHFPKVETDLDILPGTYDYYFSRVKLEEGEYILWSIYDYTKVYEDFRRFQQRRNELQVHRQLLEFRLQEFKRQEDLFHMNLALKATSSPQSGSINQLEGPLSSPFNILDSFSWMLSQAATNPQNYVYALEDFLQQLLGSVKDIRTPKEQQDWSELEASIKEQELEDGVFQWELPAEIREIPLSRFPYLGVILQSLSHAFSRPGLRTWIDTSLETGTQEFEKGDVRLEVKVVDTTKAKALKYDFQKAVMQMYLLRNLVHQAGGFLTVSSSDEKKQLSFYIRLPVKSTSPS